MADRNNLRSPPETNGYWETAARTRLVPFDQIPPHNDAFTIADMKRRVDDELAALRRVTASFRTRRNALEAVSRLPHEILAHIFAFVVRDPVNPAPVATTHMRRIQITHVCRRWREVALGSPGLWWNVDFACGDRWAEETLARAQAAPVELRLRGPRILTERQIQLLSGHLSHATMVSLVQEHDMRLFDNDAAKAFGLALTKEAPLLKSLVLRDYGAETELGIVLPADLFGGKAVRLQYVDIVNVADFPWESPVLTNLVHLSLQFSATHPSPRPPIDVVLNGLRNMARLEELDLVACVPHVPAYPNDSAPVVGLPHLKRIFLDGNVHDCTFLMQCIRLEPTVTIDFNLYCPAESGLGGVSSFLHVLSAHLGPDHRAFSKLCVDADTMDEEADIVNIHAWRDDTAPGTAADVTLDFHMGTELNINPVDIVHEFYATVPLRLEALRHLEVDAFIEWTVDDWLSLMRPARGIRTLSAGGGTIRPLCEALRFPGPYVAGATVTACCPQLSKLILSEVDLQRPASRDESIPLGVLLPMCLSQRRRLDSSLDCLVLNWCELTPDVERQLKDIIPNLTIKTKGAIDVESVHYHGDDLFS